MKKISTNGIVTENYKRAVQSALKKKGLTYKQFCELQDPNLEIHSFSSWLSGHMKNRKREQEFIDAIKSVLEV